MSEQNNYLYDNLVVINNVFKNSIEQKDISMNISHIRTSLFSHQSSMIHAMNAHRMRMTHGHLWNNQLMYGNLGILGDPQGSGKTLTVLGYISNLLNNKQSSNAHPRMCGLVDNSNRYFYSHYLDVATDASSTHLIIVPPYLFHQWKNQIETHTNLSCFYVNNKRILRNNTTPHLMVNSNIVLTTNKAYKSLSEFAKQHSIQWKQVFIDEASTIHFTGNDPLLEFEFLWLITSNWVTFLFKNIWINPSNLLYLQDRLENIHPDCLSWLQIYKDNNQHIHANLVSSNFIKHYMPFNHTGRSQLVLRSSDKALQESYTLPNPIETIVLCKQSYSLSTLRQKRDILSEQSRIPRLLESLDIGSTTVDIICNIHPEREQIIRTKVNDDCSICLDKPTHITLIKCCMNSFCGGCILRHMLTSTNCPTCRQFISLNDLIYLPNTPTDVSSEPIVSRQDACLEYIQKHKNDSIIVYAEYENIYYQLQSEIEKIGCKCERLDVNSVHQIVQDFNKGATKVIFVSNISLLNGLDLTKTQRLLFFSEQLFYDLKQTLISSAQRLNRSEPLQIVHLKTSDL